MQARDRDQQVSKDFNSEILHCLRLKLELELETNFKMLFDT